ncbi:hypothetical protein [Stappia sp. ES.058]|uniref:hypothetical protein n=1 Tax=Stappia sp. ES.058 TaxID=1881061 RepID=UPI00087B9EC7|nr:hypothetical protein [Stappia sp. ES.058]SDU48341.1 hypothetical protein SAMN05428979_4262 [Stappia sp. ES.058]
MTEALRTEIELEDGATLPGDERSETPFAELSRLMVIGIDSSIGNKLAWRAQVSPNGPWSNGWTAINDDTYATLGSGLTADGRVALAAEKSDHSGIDFIDEAGDGAGPDQSWNAPVSLGMPTGVSEIHEIALIGDASGRISVFALANTGEIWWIQQNPDRVVEETIEITPPGASEPITITVPVAQPPANVWGDWQQLGPEKMASIGAASNSDGRILLVGVESDPNSRKVFVNQQTETLTLTPEKWTGWTRIDNDASGAGSGTPTMVLDREGALNIFMIGKDADVVQIRQYPPGAMTWSPWIRPGMVGEALVNLTAAFDASGNVVLVAQDENKAIHANQQIDAIFQQWRGWQKIGTSPGFGEADMNYSADGRLYYFQGSSGDGTIACLPEATLEATSWEAGWTQLAGSGFQKPFQVVRDLTPPSSTD